MFAPLAGLGWSKLCSTFDGVRICNNHSVAGLLETLLFGFVEFLYRRPLCARPQPLPEDWAGILGDVWE